MFVRVGLDVEVYWRDDNKYWPGKIMEHKDDRFYIRYDDGCEEWLNAHHRVRLADGKKPLKMPATTKKPTVPSSLAGARVEVWWPGEKKFFAGTVRKQNGKEICVVYDDGDEDWVDGEVQDWRRLGSKRETAQLVGKRVEVLWPKEQKFFQGTVTKEKENNFLVVYDDGDESWVDRKSDEWRQVDSDVQDRSERMSSSKPEASSKTSSSKKEKTSKSGQKRKQGTSEGAGRIPLPEVGQRVEVCPPSKKQYIPGRVQRLVNDRRFLVVYDGVHAKKEEWVDCSRRFKWRLAGAAKERGGSTSAGGNKVPLPEVGQRVEVRPPSKKSYSRGMVQRREGDRRFLVVYDGMREKREEWVDCSIGFRWRLEVSDATSALKQPNNGMNKKRDLSKKGFKWRLGVAAGKEQSASTSDDAVTVPSAKCGAQSFATDASL